MTTLFNARYNLTMCLYRFRHYYRHILLLRWLKPHPHNAPTGLILASTFGFQVAAHLAIGGNGMEASALVSEGRHALARKTSSNSIQNTETTGAASVALKRQHRSRPNIVINGSEQEILHQFIDEEPKSVPMIKETVSVVEVTKDLVLFCRKCAFM